MEHRYSTKKVSKTREQKPIIDNGSWPKDINVFRIQVGVSELGDLASEDLAQQFGVQRDLSIGKVREQLFVECAMRNKKLDLHVMSAQKPSRDAVCSIADEVKAARREKDDKRGARNNRVQALETSTPAERFASAVRQ
ncbi:unnamed protein product, partial [Prorocentrum cordatum]